MASLLEISAQMEIYFRDNWIITPDIQYPDTDFNYDGLITWIALQTNPALLTQIGMDGTTTGRESLTALGTVYCYHTNMKKAIDLADDVKDFFTGVALPSDIRVNYAQYDPPQKLDNGFWEVKLNFEIVQYS